jgi:hypothetical protein
MISCFGPIMDRETAIYYLDELVLDYVIANHKRDIPKVLRLRRGMQELIEQTGINVNLDTEIINAITNFNVELRQQCH